MNEQIQGGLYQNKIFKFLEIDDHGEGVFEDFIKTRKFQEKDFPFIDQLLEIPKDILISEYHNFFYSAQDKTLERLDQLIADWKREGETETVKYKINSAEIYKDITNEYGWEVANNLNRILERLPRK